MGRRGRSSIFKSKIISLPVFLQNDVVVVDRGFRDALGVMQSLGLDVLMPPFLDHRRQFSTEESNQSRCITKIRWIVEAVNRRIKEFKYFANTVQNSSLMYLQADLSNVCALTNRYRPPITTSKPGDVEIAKEMRSLMTKKNKMETVKLERNLYDQHVCHLVFQLLNENNLLKRPSVWETIDHNDIIPEFPILSEEEIGDITLGTKLSREISLLRWISISGVFQLKRARSYVEEKVGTSKLTGTVDYTIQRCRLFPNIIRVPTKSAHKDRTTYHPIIQFSRVEILGWWCDCYIGNRFVGCCSHITSAIWFLSYQRWQSNESRRASTDRMNFVSETIPISDFYDSSDDEDTSTYRYSLS